MQHIQDILYKSCLQISQYIQTGNNYQHAAISGSNSSNDDVKHLDLWTNNLLKRNLLSCSLVKCISSEEDAKIVFSQYPDAPYMIAFDPLDGSGNIDINITIGTIFAVYQLGKDGKVKSGRQIVMAGYCMYSQTMQMVIAEKGKPVYLYFSESDRHEIRMPEKGNMYSINDSNRYRWKDNQKYTQLVDKFIAEGRTSRWIGCLVADGHRTLIKGGFFAYREDEKNTNGRIRLLYEAYPMAFIFEQAGGYSSDGKLDSLLDVEFNEENIHQKTGIILMGKGERNMI